MNQIINYKVASPSNQPSPIFSRSNLRLMLWAGDCMHSDVPDVWRLPGYDLYVCYGFNGLPSNLKALPSNAYICIIDVHDTQQLVKFLNDFGNKCSEIHSDYYGSTPSLSLDSYSILLAKGGITHTIDGIESGFNPIQEFKKFLELFAPVLTPSLQDKRQWTPRILDLAKWNDMSPSFAFTSPELKTTYMHIWEEQVAYRKDSLKINPQHSAAFLYTDATLEEYWGLLPDTILTVNIRVLFETFMDAADLLHLKSYYDRFQKFLRGRLVSTAIRDLDEYMNEQSCLDTQIHMLQKVTKWLATAKECNDVANNLVPTIGYFIDTRYNPPLRTYGFWLRKI